MSEFSIENIQQNLSHMKIPILILDERYNVVMPDKDKTPQIRKLEAKVNSLLKKQGKVTNSLKDVKKIKSRLLKEVVDDMAGDGSDDMKERMEKTQKVIGEVNDKINELEDMERDIPLKLKEANQELLLEFIQVCYGRLNTNRQDIDILEKWINEVRVELKKKLVIKQEKELKNNNIYAYMHDLLGPELIQMFDEADEDN